MDFLDLAKQGVNENLNGLLTRLYIVSTVTMSIVLVGAIRGIKRVKDYPYPLTIIFFTAANGLIFRAISLSSITKWHNQRSHLLTDFDYPRMLFYTISDLSIHLIPIVTLHRLLTRKNQSLRKDGICGIVSMGCYFITPVIFALVICLMGIGSTIPWNQDTMTAVFFNNTSSGDLGLLPAFLSLTDAMNMIYWLYALSYIVILVKHFAHFHWSFHVFCILLIVSQIVLTITSFLPQIIDSPSGILIELILQFIFLMQFPFIGLSLALALGSKWVPAPISHFEGEEMQQPVPIV